MDTRFIAHEDYLRNRANISCRILNGVLENECARYLDTLEFISSADDIDAIDHYDARTCVPVGDLTFARKFLDKAKASGYDVFDQAMTPIEIPLCLVGYAHREYVPSILGSDIPNDMKRGDRWFVKDIDTLKKWNSILYESDLSEFIESDTRYSISEKVVFLTEWRVFVHEGEELGSYNYLGDPMMFPDCDAIHEMVATYERSGNRPRAYTLDVGVISKSGVRHTVPIEIHPFVACGLYGFSDRRVVRMLDDGYKWYLNGNASA